MTDDSWKIGSLTLTSRVLLGTATYPNLETMLESLKASTAQLVTMSLRRVNVETPGSENLYKILQERGYHLLPNTAGCFTAKEAVLTAQMAREALDTDLIKLEVIFFSKDEYDTRIKHIFLNEKGKEIFNEIFEVQKKRIYNALLNSSSQEVLSFDEVLNKIING